MPTLPPTRRLHIQEHGKRRTLEVTSVGVFLTPSPGGLRVGHRPGPGALLALKATPEGILVTPAMAGATVNGEALERPRQLGRFDLLEIAGAILRSEADGLEPTQSEVEDVAPTVARPLPQVGQLFAGRYQLGGTIGEGGFGVVYRAQDTQLQRAVAIKVLMRAEGRSLQRFAMEIRATAALQHPNLVTVHDSGIEGGHPFLVMEFVEGETLADAAEKGMRPTQAATVMRDVTRGLAYAHQQGLLHRDIKPQNILISTEGRAVLLDFGLVRLLDSESDQRITKTGVRLGTLPYMSPEQAFASDLDERSEVYSLGASLYHALAGTYPFEEAGDDILVAVVSGDPVSPNKARPGVPPDLEAIALKCMEKRPADRYATAAALAADLERFLEGEPTEARPLTPFQRRLRQARRNRVLTATIVVAAVLVLGLLAFGVVGGLYTVERVREERDLAEAEREKADTARADAEREREKASQAAAREADARRQAEADSAAKDGLLATALAEKGERLLAAKRHESAAALFARSLEFVDSTQARTGLASALEQSHRRAWAGGIRVQTAVVFADNGHILTGTNDGAVWLYEVKRFRAEAVGEQEGPVLAVAAGKGGWSAAGDEDGTLRIWRPGRKEPIILEGHTGRVEALAFSADGSEIASVGLDGVLRRWDTSPATKLGAFKTAGRLLSVAYDPEGRWLAAGGEAGVVVVDLGTGDVAQSLILRGWITGVAFLDGQLLTSGLDGNVRRWDVATGREVDRIKVGSPVAALTLSSSGQVTVGTTSGEVKVYDASGAQVYSDDAHRGWVKGVSWSPDGRLLVSVAQDSLRLHFLKESKANAISFREKRNVLVVDRSGSFAAVGDDMGVVRLWSLQKKEAGRFSDHGGRSVQAVACGLGVKKQGLLASGDVTGRIVVRDLREGTVTRLVGHTKTIHGLDFDPRAATLVSGGADGKVIFWSMEGGQEIGRIDVGAPVADLDVDNGGSLVAVATSKGTQVFRFESKERIANYPGAAAAVAFDPKGLKVAVADRDEVRVWTLASASLPVRLVGHRGDVTSVGFSPTGIGLITGSADRTVGVWDAARGVLLARLEGHRDRVTDVAFDPRGARGFSVGWDGEFRFWNLLTDLAPKLVPMGPRSLSDMEFSADGRLLAGGHDGHLYAWTPGERAASKLAFHGAGPIRAIASSANGRLVATCSEVEHGAIKVWDAKTGKLTQTLAGHERGASALVFFRSGSRSLLASAGQDRRVVLWDPLAGELVREWPVPKEDEFASSLAFNQATDRLATGGLHTVRYWSLNGREMGSCFLAEGMMARGIAFDRSGRLATAGMAMTNRQPQRRFDVPGANRLSSSLRGVGLIGESRLWDLQGGYQRLRRHNGLCFGVDFSPDGRLLAESGGGVLLWSVETGRLFARLAPEDEETGRLAITFGPQGRLLAVPTASGAAMIWDLELLGLLSKPSEAVHLVWKRTGLGVVGMEPVAVEHPVWLDLLRAASGE